MRVFVKAVIWPYMCSTFPHNVPVEEQKKKQNKTLVSSSVLCGLGLVLEQGR